MIRFLIFVSNLTFLDFAKKYENIPKLYSNIYKIYKIYTIYIYIYIYIYIQIYTIYIFTSPALHARLVPSPLKMAFGKVMFNQVFFNKPLKVSQYPY